MQYGKKTIILQKMDKIEYVGILSSFINKIFTLKKIGQVLLRVRK